MKRTVLFLCFSLFVTSMVSAYSFSAVAPSGQTLYYNIVGSGRVEITHQNGNVPFYSDYPTGALTIPDNVTYYGTSYTVTSIGSYAFYGCSGLSSVTIPSSVTSIGNSAFHFCNLTSITIPSSITSIGEDAFNGCNSLTSVTIPSSVTSIGNGAFVNVRHIEYNGSATGSPWGAISMNGVADSDFIYSDTSKRYVFVYIGSSGDVAIPSTVDTIGHYAFYHCSGLTSVTIPPSVTSIGDYAFSGCSSLTSITIPSSVTSVGVSAFEGCSGLTLATIPSSITSIGNSTFLGCGSLTSVTIPTSVASIGYSAFKDCSSLTSVTIPSSVTSIGNSAFFNVRHIEYNGSATGSPWGAISMNGVTDGDFVFSDATKHYLLAYSGVGGDVTIPSTVDAIGPKAFYSCIGLKSVTIPDGITSIGTRAFYGCSGLAEMRMKPATPPTLGNTSSICDSIIYLVVPRNSYNAYTSAGTDYTRHRIFRDTVFVTIAVNDTIRGYSNEAVLSYPYPDTIEVVATPYYGYHFARWDDNTTDSIRRISNIIQDISLTAFFDYNQYSITLLADTSIHGTVIGSGAYNYLSERFIGATANYGYHFIHWLDGDTNNPRTVTLTQDTSFMAMFANNQYMVIGITSDSIKGIVSGSTTANYLDSVTLSATANYGFHFLRWSDYNTSNPRKVVVTDDISLTALWGYNQYSITLLADTSIHGTVIGSGAYNYLSERAIGATANHGYHFTHWQDGNTNNPRTFILTQDTQFVAYYDKDVYTLTFQSNNSDIGIVNTTSVSSEYLDTTIQIYATAIPHHHFVRWNDNNTENPRRFVFDDNRTYTAYFAIDEHTVNVQVDNLAHGTVSGAGTREYGQPITVSATPYSGYQFAHWSDGSTYNPYTFAVLEDKSLTAIFIADGEPWQDTVVVYDTTYITLHDTTYINVAVHDTTFIAVHDTAYINVLVHDTTYINVPVHDTTYITVTDTLTVTQYDTVTNTVYDTINNYIHDTVTVTDTLWLTQTDTLWLHDTIIIHDTVYVTQEGIGDVDALNAKVYTSQGQIVVEGADGNMVTLYDVNGRMLATKRDEYAPLRFDAPASGTYMIRIGNHPARKVVVMR